MPVEEEERGGDQQGNRCDEQALPSQRAVQKIGEAAGGGPSRPAITITGSLMNLPARNGGMRCSIGTFVTPSGSVGDGSAIAVALQVMAEQRDQNDEWDGHAEEQQQDRPHGRSPLSGITRGTGRWLHNCDVISLPAPNSCGETRAKRANQ